MVGILFMAKDPAFLFYYQDFLVGTDDMSNDEVGAYIRCLCHQAAKSSISEKRMMKICLRQDVYETVSSKFVRGEDGNYCNDRLASEISKRKAIAESRQKLRHAFDRLSQLQSDINANLDADSKPTGKVFVPGAGKKAAQAAARKQKAANNKKVKKKKSK